MGPRAALGRVRAIDFVEHLPRHLASDTYTRIELEATDAGLIVLILWKPGQFSRAHDHGGSRCSFRVLQGVATERRFKRLDADRVVLVDEDRFLPSSIVSCNGDEVHAMGNDPASAELLVTLHIYRPRPAMREYLVVQEVGHD
jgi:cysteine dioxygenase